MHHTTVSSEVCLRAEPVGIVSNDGHQWHQKNTRSVHSHGKSGKSRRCNLGDQLRCLVFKLVPGHAGCRTPVTAAGSSWWRPRAVRVSDGRTR